MQLSYQTRKAIMCGELIVFVHIRSQNVCDTFDVLASICLVVGVTVVVVDTNVRQV